ncbi:MAG: hypothetical protein QNJ51_21175 [Calothrix sp. MO_167.B12]|nr:hypothetical protein [Calothrix sp. MO_167.B12]
MNYSLSRDNNQDEPSISLVNISEPTSEVLKATINTFGRIATAFGQTTTAIGQTTTAGINYFRELQQIKAKELDIEANKELEAKRQKHEKLMLKREFIEIHKLQKNQHKHEAKQDKKAFEYQQNLAKSVFEYQQKLAKQSKEYIKEIEAFNAKLRQNELEAQKELELELKLFERETQIYLANMHFDEVLTSIEHRNFIDDKYPLSTLPRQISNFYQQYCINDKPVLPLVIIPPLTIHSKQVSEPNKVSKTLSKNLYNFLTQQHYHLNSDSPVKFIRENWKNPDMLLETASHHLFDVYKKIPTLILKLELEDGEKEDMLTLNIETVWWNGRVGYSDPFSSNPIPIDNQGNSNLSSYLSAILRLLTGSIIDEYYLFHYQVCPKLPEVLQELTDHLPEQVRRELIHVITSRYETVFRKLATDRPAVSVDLALELAQILSNLHDKTVQSVARNLASFAEQVLNDYPNI